MTNQTSTAGKKKSDLPAQKKRIKPLRERNLIDDYMLDAPLLDQGK